MNTLSLPVQTEGLPENGNQYEQGIKNPLAASWGSVLNQVCSRRAMLKTIGLSSLLTLIPQESNGVNISPANTMLKDRVDLIEVNHFYDEQGRFVYDQIVFYDWCPRECRYQLRDWRLIKNGNQIPLQDAKTGEFTAVWSDFKSRNVLRKTTARLFRESWTQYDPELVEREFLPESKRKKLREILPPEEKSPLRDLFRAWGVGVPADVGP